MPSTPAPATEPHDPEAPPSTQDGPTAADGRAARRPEADPSRFKEKGAATLRTDLSDGQADGHADGLVETRAPGCCTSKHDPRMPDAELLKRGCNGVHDTSDDSSSPRCQLDVPYVSPNAGYSDVPDSWEA